MITKLRLCHYPVKPVYFNLSVHELQFHSCSFNVECKTKSPRLSQSTPMELLVKMVQHFRLQLFRISTWFSWFPYSVHYYISATNICDFHFLQLNIFPPAVFKISIFCDLSCHIRLQTSRFPQTTTCKISACNFLDFHAVNLKRFPPAVFWEFHMVQYVGFPFVTLLISTMKSARGNKREALTFISASVACTITNQLKHKGQLALMFLLNKSVYILCGS